VVFENIEHLKLGGVCVLVGGCIVSLVGMRVCVLVSSGGVKITFSCLRVIHMKQRLGKQLIYLFNRGDENSWRILYEGWNFNSGNYLFTTDTK